MATAPMNLDEMVAAELAKQLGTDMSPKGKAPPPEVKVAAAPVVLKSGEKSAYDVMGIKAHPSIADFAVRILDPTLVPEEIRMHIPDTDPHYMPDVTAALMVLSAWGNKEKVMIYGLPGTGKSSLIRHLCALVNRPFIRVNFAEDIESSALLGGMVVEGGGTVYKLGALAEAVKFGAVFLADEWDTASAGVTMCAQWLLEDGGKLFLRDMPGTNAERTLTPDEEFLFVATGNTMGQGDDSGMFAGTTVQNSATIDRFTTAFKMEYLPPAQESAMIEARTGVSKATADKMVKVAGLIRNAVAAGQLTFTMSPRTLISWGMKHARFGDKAVEVSFINKLRSTDAKVVRDFVNKVFGYRS
jgi:cobaltochelatase CobS